MPHDQGLLEPGRPVVGVASKGRGFAPAGRGRGIAKWSSQAEDGISNSGNSIPEVGRKNSHRDTNSVGSSSRYTTNQEGGGHRYHNNDSGSRHSSETGSRNNHGNGSGGYNDGGSRGYHANGFKRDNYDNGSSREYQDDGSSRRYRDNESNRGYQDNGPRNSYANGGSGPRHKNHEVSRAGGPSRHGHDAGPRHKLRDNVECYRCEGIGHLSYECPSKFNVKESRRVYRNETSPCFEDADSDPSQGGSVDSGRGSKHSNRSGSKHNNDHNNSRGGNAESFNCYACGEPGHLARDCFQNERNNSSRHHGAKPNLIVKNCFDCGDPGHEARDCNYNQNKNPSDNKYNKHKKGIPSNPAYEEEAMFDSTAATAGINFSKFEDIDVNVSGTGAVNRIESFEESCLNPVILNNVTKCGYIQPTPIQRHAIPNIINGRDLMACSQTGSGKTAAFLLPVIHLLLEQFAASSRCIESSHAPEVIVVVPTRELAIQIRDEAKRYSASTGLRSALAYGGTGYQEQMDRIKEGCNLLIATPGRLIDFVEKNIVSLAKVKFLVLDEADRMLEIGFHDKILQLVRNPDMPTTRARQTLMFSATFPDSIQRLAAEFLHEYLFLSVGIIGGASSDVAQTLLQVSQFEKREKLLNLLQTVYDVYKNSKTLIFVQMKKTADFLASYLCQSDLATTSIHGDRLQEEREEALRDFRKGVKPILVATAVAARGLDVKNVELVVNYDLPKGVEEYVHRIGRTGRVGNTGRAISFYDSCNDGPIAQDLYKVLLDAQQTVPDWLVQESRRNPGIGYGPGSGGQTTTDKDVRLKEREERSNSSDNWR